MAVEEAEHDQGNVADGEPECAKRERERGKAQRQQQQHAQQECLDEEHLGLGQLTQEIFA